MPLSIRQLTGLRTLRLERNPCLRGPVPREIASKPDCLVSADEPVLEDTEAQALGARLGDWFLMPREVGAKLVFTCSGKAPNRVGRGRREFQDGWGVSPPGRLESTASRDPPRTWSLREGLVDIMTHSTSVRPLLSRFVRSAQGSELGPGRELVWLVRVRDRQGCFKRIASSVHRTAIAVGCLPYIRSCSKVEYGNQMRSSEACVERSLFPRQCLTLGGEIPGSLFHPPPSPPSSDDYVPRQRPQAFLRLPEFPGYSRVRSSLVRHVSTVVPYECHVFADCRGRRLVVRRSEIAFFSHCWDLPRDQVCHHSGGVFYKGVLGGGEGGGTGLLGLVPPAFGVVQGRIEVAAVGSWGWTLVAQSGVRSGTPMMPFDGEASADSPAMKRWFFLRFVRDGGGDCTLSFSPRLNDVFAQRLSIVAMEFSPSNYAPGDSSWATRAPPPCHNPRLVPTRAQRAGGPTPGHCRQG